MFYGKIARKPVWQIGRLSVILLVVALTVSQAGAGDIRGGVYRQTRFSPQPVPFFGARVELLLPPNQVVFVSYVGPDGLYQMRNVRAGSYMLRVNGTMMFPLTVLSTQFQDVPPIRISQ
jgi:hypothetical protein